MEAAGLWKAAPKKPARLPTALGKRRHEPAGVSHSSHSPRRWKKQDEHQPPGYTVPTWPSKVLPMSPV